FALPGGTACIGRYVPIRQLTSTWAAHYWVVPLIEVVSSSLPPEIDRQAVAAEGGRRRRGRRRGRKTWSPSIRHPCDPSPETLARSSACGRFLLTARGEETSPCMGRRNISPHREKERGDSVY
ncbi:hypothetical protein BHM03_00058226, partial [Ensete ventricosum]